MRPHAIGHAGERVVAQLWPSLRLVSSGQAHDRAGIDAWDGETRIQIKTDRTIATLDNVFWETEKRNASGAHAWATYRPESTTWRISPGSAYDHIFCTIACAVRVPYRTLCRIVEADLLRPIAITETARGYLIPFPRLRREPAVEFRWWF